MCGRVFIGKSGQRSQTKRSIANITLDIVAGGRKAISDAFFDDDIENIASALSGQEKIICVDPGPFTAAFIEQKMGFQKQDGIFLLKRKEAYICK